MKHPAHGLDDTLSLAEKCAREVLHGSSDPAPVSATQVDAHGHGFDQVSQMCVIGVDQGEEGGCLRYLLACSLQV